MLKDLQEKVKIAAATNVSAWKTNRQTAHPPAPIRNRALAESTNKVIAIGASTGGTVAIRQILQHLPPTSPGIVMVQHMPPGFTKHFADSLNDICELEVLEAKTGDKVIPGRVLVAPGDKHLTVRRSGGEYLVDCRAGRNVCGHCPSVEVLFQSVAEQVGANAIGIILTGMGNDGAEGMLAMRQTGARTIAQDESTSVVYGMPKVAYERGGVERVLPLPAIAKMVLALLRN